MDAAEVFELFRASGAMLEGHFELSSGLHSDRYFQCALLLQNPRRAEQLAQGLAPLIPKVDLVVGPALGAVTWAHEMARALGVDGIFTERKDGEMVLRRGFTIEPGTKVLVVEDVLTTGGSAKEVLRVLKELGADVVAVGSILNRSGGNPFEEFGLPLYCLAEAEVQTWEPAACPLCAAGTAAIKPGSRTQAACTGEAAGGAI
jgi:orotate phosphoribosyltransferase